VRIEEPLIQRLPELGCLLQCGKLGHRSINCRATTLQPTNTQAIPHKPKPQLTVSYPPTNNHQPKTCQEMNKINAAEEYAMIRLSPNEENQVLQETLTRSIIISDDRKLGSLYIRTHLQQIFPFSGFAWVA
jgi:hypothetical protein